MEWCGYYSLLTKIEIFGGVLASTWYVDVREHVERRLCARKLSSRIISAEPNCAQLNFAIATA